MDKINNKRSRSSNWSESEKALLTRLIKENIHLIENKDVTKNNNQIKKAAWQEILQSFNQINDTKRDLTQLVNQWRNTKNNIKKRQFEYRRNCSATGGGPRPPSPPPEDVEIMEILPNEFEVDENIYDSDSLNIIKDDTLKEENEVDQPSCSSSLLPLQPTEIVQRTPERHQKSNNKNIRANKKKVTFGTSEQKDLFILAKSAREKQMRHQEAEHTKRMEIMEEEHRMRVEIMKKELEFWEKKLAE